MWVNVGRRFILFTGGEPDVSDLVSGNIISDFRFSISEGERHKLLSGYQIHSLLKKSHLGIKSDFSFEINDSSMCP